MGFGIQDLFNPMSLIQDLSQEFQGMLDPSKQQNQAGATQSGNQLMSMLGMGGAQNTASPFGGGQDPSCAGASSTPCAATTEFPSQGACPAGYANSSQAATAAPATPVDPELLSTMTAVVGNFGQFDAQYAASAFKDGQFDMNNVENIVQHPGDFPQSVYSAAVYLDQHQDVFNQMAMLSGGTGEVTAAGAQAYMNHLTAAGAAQNQQGIAQQQTPPPPSYTPPTLPHGCHPGVQDCAKTGATRTYGANGTTMAGGGSSSSGMTGLQDEISTYAQTEEANKQAELDKAISDGKDPQAIQKLAEQLQQMTTIFSNVEKMIQDMMMNTINNTR